MCHVEVGLGSERIQRAGTSEGWQATWADYLGGHPEFEHAVAGGQLRLDEGSQVLTYLIPDSEADNPVVLKPKLRDAFVVPVVGLHGARLAAGDVVSALASAARCSIFLGAWGAATALDEHRGAHLVLSGTIAERDCRLAFAVNESDGRSMLALIDGRRSSIGLPALVDVDASTAPSAVVSGPSDALTLIALKLEEQGRLLTAILDRLPPKS